MDTQTYLTQFYESYDEAGRLSTRHGFVEYTTTMHYITKYLRPGMRILEIGAGTGRYSHTLARNGFTVDAVELVQHNIDLFCAHTHPDEQISIRQGDARNLGMFPDHTYDLTLLLGPMYHLFEEEHKKQALSEAIRVTKPGGIVFVAYCGNDATILQFCFQLGMFRDEHYRNLIDPDTFKAHSDPTELFELHRPEEIIALREGFDITPLHLVATDGFARYMRQDLAKMDDFLYENYLRYHLATCERVDMLGYSNHYLDIFQKNALV